MPDSVRSLLPLDRSVKRIVSRSRRISQRMPAAGSPVRVIVVPTNEELMIARDTRDVAKAK